jgi:hypothetical protein
MALRSSFIMVARRSVVCSIAIAAFACRAETAPPIKIAVFDFELEDYSAGGGIIGETPEDIAQLRRATGDARQLLAQSGRYSLVDVRHADAEPARAQSLPMCDGCEADIAHKRCRPILGRCNRQIEPDRICRGLSNPRHQGRQHGLQATDRASHGNQRFLESRRHSVDEKYPAG